MNPICFFMYIVVSPAQKEDNFFINTKYQSLIYQWLTSHIANWLHLGAELPFLNNISHQNYIGPRLRVRKIKKAPFLNCFTRILICFGSEFPYLYTYVHM